MSEENDQNVVSSRRHGQCRYFGHILIMFVWVFFVWLMFWSLLRDNIADKGLSNETFTQFSDVIYGPPPLLFHVICRNHNSVLRQRVYFWYFYLRNIALMNKKNSSYQVKFNFIRVFVLFWSFNFLNYWYFCLSNLGSLPALFANINF